VSVGDDNIAIKSDAAEKDGSAGTTDIAVRNSTFGTGHGASIGSDTSGGMKNISFENLTFNGTDAGVRVKSSRERGGVLTNISYKNLTMNNVGRAIQITDFYGSSVNDTVAAIAQPVTKTTPKHSNITVENVVSTNTKKAGEVTGLLESPITGVTLKNITISGSQGMDFYNSTVALDGVKITATNNKPLVKHIGANVTGQ
jgi:polygalacturonase